MRRGDTRADPFAPDAMVVMAVGAPKTLFEEGQGEGGRAGGERGGRREEERGLAAHPHLPPPSTHTRTRPRAGKANDEEGLE